MNTHDLRSNARRAGALRPLVVILPVCWGLALLKRLLQVFRHPRIYKVCREACKLQPTVANRDGSRMNVLTEHV